MEAVQLTEFFYQLFASVNALMTQSRRRLRAGKEIFSSLITVGENTGRRANRTCISLMLGSLLALAIPTSATAAQLCTNLPPSNLRMYGTELKGIDAVPVTSIGLNQLAESHKITAEMRNAHPLMLLIPKIDLHFSTDERSIEVAPNTFCASPQHVEIMFGMTAYVAYIDQRAYDDECMRSRLLQHAELHVDADKEEMSAFLREMSEPLHERLTQLKMSPAPDPKAAIEQFRSGLGEFLLAATGEFGHDRLRSQAAIDTPSVISELRAACDGHVQLPESQPHLPGQKTSRDRST